MALELRIMSGSDVTLAPQYGKLKTAILYLFHAFLCKIPYRILEYLHTNRPFQIPLLFLDMVLIFKKMYLVTVNPMEF